MGLRILLKSYLQFQKSNPLAQSNRHRQSEMVNRGNVSLLSWALVWCVAVIRGARINTLLSFAQENVIYILYDKCFQTYIKGKRKMNSHRISFQIRHDQPFATLASSILFFHSLSLPFFFPILPSLPFFSPFLSFPCRSTVKQISYVILFCPYISQYL